MRLRMSGLLALRDYGMFSAAVAVTGDILVAAFIGSLLIKSAYPFRDKLPDRVVASVEVEIDAKELDRLSFSEVIARLRAQLDAAEILLSNDYHPKVPQ